MHTPNIHLVICTANVDFLASLEGVCNETGAIAHSATPETITQIAEATQAGCIVYEFASVDSASLQLLDQCRRNHPDIPFIALLAQSSSSEASRLIRFGAFDCLDISASHDELLQSILSAKAQHSSPKREDELWRQHLVGESTPIDQVVRVIRLVAPRRCTVLISGETGTGKELAARAIHLASDRARKPLVSINCSAIPENLIEAELFGHVKGAFTGAVNPRVGRFEQAHGGTLFLDEIADLPLDLQAKLLRVLQEREVQRLGSSETVKIDVRVIAATNADLLTRVQQGRFREDLYYRLNVVPINMPALRDRSCDIPLLARHFVQKVCSAEGIPVKRIAAEGDAMLNRYAWPGNVRQLENVVEHAVVMSGDRERLYPSDFVVPRAELQPEAPAIRIPPGRMPEGGLNYMDALRQFERTILQQALSKANGNKTLAADMLKLPRTTLLHKLRALDQAAA
jgi:DNA-binding NtrC family response regulator